MRKGVTLTMAAAAASATCSPEASFTPHTRTHTHTHGGARTQTQDCCSNTSQRKVDDKRRSSSVWWWRVTFYLIIRIRLHILWCSMMHCGQRRDDTMDKARKLSWAVGKQKFRGWEWSSKKTRKGIIKMKTLRLIKKKEKHIQQSNKSGKMKKTKSVSGNQSTPQQTNTRVFFCQQTVHLYPQWARQENKARSARVAACVRRGFRVAHAGYDSNKRHERKAVVSTPKWTWMAPPDDKHYNSFPCTWHVVA